MTQPRDLDLETWERVPWPRSKRTPAMMHNAEDLRFRCLQLAFETERRCPQTVALAQAYFAFVSGETALTPLERAKAALAELEAADVR